MRRADAVRRSTAYASCGGLDGQQSGVLDFRSHARAAASEVRPAPAFVPPRAGAAEPARPAQKSRAILREQDQEAARPQLEPEPAQVAHLE